MIGRKAVPCLKVSLIASENKCESNKEIRFTAMRGFFRCQLLAGDESRLALLLQAVESMVHFVGKTLTYRFPYWPLLRS